VEFVTLTLWESLDTVREFASQDYEASVVSAKARTLLSRFESISLHYDTIFTPDGGETPAQGPS